MDVSTLLPVGLWYGFGRTQDFDLFGLKFNNCWPYVLEDSVGLITILKMHMECGLNQLIISY